LTVTEHLHRDGRAVRTRKKQHPAPHYTIPPTDGGQERRRVRGVAQWPAQVAATVDPNHCAHMSIMSV